MYEPRAMEPTIVRWDDATPDAPVPTADADKEKVYRIGVIGH